VAKAYDKRGRLLATGHNSYTRTHSVQAHYGRKVGKPKAIYIHAEIDALLKARQPVYRMVVERRGENGTPLIAKPCEACALALKDYGVKIVEHT
jgi:deoxycytidylate deaminase